MKRFLPKQTNCISLQKGFSKPSTLHNYDDSNSVRMLKHLLGTVFIMLMLSFLVINVSAQTVENIDSYLKNTDATEAQALQELTNGDNATIFLFDNEFEIEGDRPVKVANVSAKEINQLYTSHEEFEGVELIKIKIKNKTDLLTRLNVEDLNQFQNLKYIYVVASFDICPENSGDIDCQKSKISNIVLFDEDQENIKVIFRIIALM